MEEQKEKAIKKKSSGGGSKKREGVKAKATESSNEKTQKLEKIDGKSSKNNENLSKNEKSCKKSLLYSKTLMWCLIGGIFVAMVLAVVISFVCIESKNKKADAVTKIEINVAQIENEQNLLLTWETDKSLNGLNVVVKHGGDVFYETTITNAQTLAKKKIELPVSYGKYNVEVTPIRNGIRSETKTAEAKLSTDEYVIAPLFATMPVTYFTLNLESVTNNYTIPTFVWFQRGQSWDYSNMPSNVNIMPVADAQTLESFVDIHYIYEKTADWIKELYDINPNSKFHLYYNDILSFGVVNMAVKNDIPTSAYDVVLITDGVGTYIAFNDYFENAEDTTAVYNGMVEKYNQFKEDVKAHGYYSPYKNASDYCLTDTEFWGYAYVMAKEEPNVQWWITRYSGTMASNMQTELASLASEGKLKTQSMSSLLPTDEQEIENLKNLYNLSETMFEASKTQSKKSMIILGKNVANETDFEDYVKATMKFYGDDYVYYYKGHPKTPTDLYPEKQEQLERLGVIDIDSSIAAELIILLNPEVYVTGYESSTWDSLPEGQCCGMIGKNYSDVDYSYKDKLDFFINKASSVSGIPSSLIECERSYVFQFISNDDYDIAIYNAETDTIKYYKKSGTDFNLVNV